MKAILLSIALTLLSACASQEALSLEQEVAESRRHKHDIHHVAFKPSTMRPIQLTLLSK